MTVIQRCAWTVQLQPSMAHIPGWTASTMHGRSARYHKNTEHTIARSHLMSPSRASYTLRLALIVTISARENGREAGRSVVRVQSDRRVRSSPAAATADYSLRDRLPLITDRSPPASHSARCTRGPSGPLPAQSANRPCGSIREPSTTFVSLLYSW